MGALTCERQDGSMCVGAFIWECVSGSFLFGAFRSEPLQGSPFVLEPRYGNLPSDVVLQGTFCELWSCSAHFIECGLMSIASFYE